MFVKTELGFFCHLKVLGLVSLVACAVAAEIMLMFYLKCVHFNWRSRANDGADQPEQPHGGGGGGGGGEGLGVGVEKLAKYQLTKPE